MARHPRSVDQAIARFDDLVMRLDGKAPAGRGARIDRGGNVRGLAQRLATIGMAITALIAATIGFGLFVGPIGWSGLFIVSIAILFILIFFSMRPIDPEPRRVQYSEELPTKTIVQQLDTMLARRRAALPAPAARRVDDISRQLPLLESRLGEIDALDPLAQDARRLMGKHLPELIDRYQRVPARYRNEREGDGMSVDERLVAGLDAARQALDEIGAKLSKQDIDAFETQGRFLESRYKDGGVSDGS